MLKVGITGGIGSGKSTVCEVFHHLNIKIFNADKAAKEIINYDADVKSKLISIFGKEIYENSEKINKQKFAEIIFNNQKSLSIVNSIVHPVVMSKFDEFVYSHNMSKYIIKEAAILFESGSYKKLDKTITISAPEKLRIQRVISRDNVDRQVVIDRMKNQISEKERINRADFVIVNDEKTLLIPQILQIDNILKNLK